MTRLTMFCRSVAIKYKDWRDAIDIVCIYVSMFICIYVCHILGDTPWTGIIECRPVVSELAHPLINTF